MQFLEIKERRGEGWLVTITTNLATQLHRDPEAGAQLPQ